MLKRFSLTLLILISWSFAQTTVGPYQFSTIKNNEASPVDNQFRTYTCWSFSSLSFFESELKRLGKPTVNLSEMYVVRNTYAAKARRYIRMHGNSTFAPGGAFYDAINIFTSHGIVPEDVYAGKDYGEKKHIHTEMDAVLEASIKALVTNPNGRLSSAWPQVIEGILDAYLGEVPESFNWEGKNYTPKTFLQYTGIQPEDYIQVGSYTHHPFYSKFALEVPDNWTNSLVLNIPLDEFAKLLEKAVTEGYPVAWATDVSDKGFSHKNGLAIVPQNEFNEMKKAELDSIFAKPISQRIITQEMRQKAFDNYETQDDHGMHITGLVKDQNGNTFYIVKNSYGADSNDCGGYVYASESYVLYKTTCIMVHKDAIPAELKAKIK